MRLVIARCSVDYVGRLTAHLPEAVRLLLVKADGSLSIHADDRAYKPLMWMSPPCSSRYGSAQEAAQEAAAQEAVWTVTNKAGEQLLITVHEILSDVSHELGTDPGLVKDGVEKQLQELLADQCHVLGEGFTLVQREYFTDIGPVDLLCRDAGGAHVLVEIKRHAEIDAVEQLTRYLQRVSTGVGRGAGDPGGPVVQAPGQGAGGGPRHHLRAGRLRGAQGHGVNRAHAVLMPTFAMRLPVCQDAVSTGR